MTKRIAILTASRGTMIGHALSHPGVRSAVAAIISDRPCGALELGQRLGLETALLEHRDNAALSAAVCQWARDNSIDAIITVFSRMLTEPLISEFHGRLFNMHPSLLPAFPGLGSFDKAMKAGALFVGETVHAIDATMDGGPMLMQVAIPTACRDPRLVRHDLFVAETKMLMQLVLWLAASRVVLDDGRARVQGGAPSDDWFSPALEDALVRDFHLPPPA